MLVAALLCPASLLVMHMSLKAFSMFKGGPHKDLNITSRILILWV
jgi:hypothetical protein